MEAPPRLAAHLRAVHDVAWQICDWVAGYHPALRLDREAALFGAATHDIGKAVHVGEPSGPGAEHEEAGQDLLLAHGVSPALARNAATHAGLGQARYADRGSASQRGRQDSVADKIWKASASPTWRTGCLRASRPPAAVTPGSVLACAMPNASRYAYKAWRTATKTRRRTSGRTTSACACSCHRRWRSWR